MNIRDIAIVHPPERRRVWVRFQEHRHVMAAAVRIYRELDIACDVTDNTISLEVPRVTAQFYAGLLERATGTPAHNDWQPTAKEN